MDRAGSLVPGALVDGRYSLEARLGSGTYGDVWRAADLRLRGRVVALKFLRAEFLDRPEIVARFETEADALATVQHPNVIAVSDRGAWGPARYIVMEHVAGGTLAAWLDQHRAARRLPDLAAARALFDQLCAGVAAAHAVRAPGPVVHRDLKPENVLLRADETGQLSVKVLDFGVAQLGARRGTQTGMRMGTLTYMAPEQGLGRASEVGPWSDVFTLAVILVELLTLRATPGGEDTFWGAALAGAADLEARLASWRPEVPVAVWRVVARALQPAAAARIPDAGALRAALDAAWRGASAASSIAFLPTVAVPSGMLHAPPPAGTAPMAVPRTEYMAAPLAPPAAPPRPRRSRAGLLAAVALLLLALAGGAAWHLASPSSAPEPAPVPAPVPPPPAPPDECSAPVESRWQASMGSLARGAACGLYVGSTNAVTGAYSSGRFDYVRPVSTDFELSVRVRRLTDDHDRPMEVYFLGGAFAINTQGSWYFYESESHWSGWQQSDAITPGENRLVVRQQGATVTAFVNGQFVASFVLARAPSPGRVAMFLKGAPGTASQMEFWDFTVRDLAAP